MIQGCINPKPLFTLRAVNQSLSAAGVKEEQAWSACLDHVFIVSSVQYLQSKTKLVTHILVLVFDDIIYIKKRFTEMFINDKT